MTSRLLLIVFYLSAVLTASAEMCVGLGSAKDSETGLYGITYNGEWLLLPKYEGITMEKLATYKGDEAKWQPQKREYDDSGVFVYKENGKLGLATVFYELTDAIYDEAVPIPAFNACWVKKDGFYGVVNFFGQEIIPIEYTSLSRPISLTHNSKVYPGMFLAEKDGRKMLISRYGDLLLDGVSEADFNQSEIPALAGRLAQVYNFNKVEASRRRYENRTKRCLLPPLIMGYPQNYRGEFDSELNYRYASTVHVATKPDGHIVLLCGDWIGEFENDDPMADYFTTLVTSTASPKAYMLSKKAGKYGVSVLGKTLIEPIYDKVSVEWKNIDIPNFRVTKGNKIGLYNCFGEEILKPEYDYLQLLNAQNIDSHPAGNAGGTCFFEVGKDGVYSIIDEYGHVLLTGNQKPGKYGKKKVYKAIEEYLKENPVFDYKKLFEDRLALAKSRGYDDITKVGGWPREEMQYTGAAAGQVGYIYENGLVTTPLRENHPQLLARRMPQSPVAAFYLLDNTPVTQVNLQFITTNNYDEASRALSESKAILDGIRNVKSMASNMQYTPQSRFMQQIDESIANRESYISKLEPEVNKVARLIQLNSRIDAVSGAVTSAIQNAAQVYSSFQRGSGGNTERGASHSTSSPRSTSDSKYNISEKTSCDVAKRAYDNYESQLMKMRTFPEKFDKSQKESIQQKMMQLRTKWENQGYNMRRSELETW